MKAPESKHSSSLQRREDDLKFCYEELGMEKNIVTRCYRVGKIDVNRTDHCRPLVIELKTVDDVGYWTNDGNG